RRQREHGAAMRRVTWSSALRFARLGVAALIVGAMWWLACGPSGFSVFELMVFTGPSIMLAVAASWVAHAFDPWTWSWRTAARAAVLGAVLLPPAFGFCVAYAATF